MRTRRNPTSIVQPMRDVSAGTYCITAFGATADGVICTTAIQATIDACAGDGGGTVLCPAGVFVTGTLRLRSHVELHLAPGCTLLASPERSAYDEDSGMVERDVFADENTSDAHLVIGYRLVDASITGAGTIDGNNRAFLPLVAGADKWDLKRFPWRPGQMVHFCRCETVRIEGIRLVNAPYWTLFFHGCRDVRARGLTIINSHLTPNGDGIDIDCCRDVAVSDCTISTGDDSITLRAHAAPLGEHAQPCENVVVQNCVLSSACNAIRVGVGGGVIRNCSFSNLVIHDTRTGIDVISSYQSMPNTPSATIHDLDFRNLRITARTAFRVSTGTYGTAPVERLSFSDISACVDAPSYVGGNVDLPVRQVSFTNIRYSLHGGTSNRPLGTSIDRRYPGSLMSNGVPLGILLWDAVDLRFSNLDFRWDHTTGPWEAAILARKVQGLCCDACGFSGEDPQGLRTTLQVVESSGLDLHGCRFLSAAGPAVTISDSVLSGPPPTVRSTLFRCPVPAITSDVPVLESGNLTVQFGGDSPA